MRILILSLITYILSPLIFIIYLIIPKLRNNINQRLLLIKHINPSQKKCSVMFHGASAGDIIALLPLINRIKIKCNNIGLLVTTMTNSGLEVAKKNLVNISKFCLMPIDHPHLTNKFIIDNNIKLLILERLELWPHLIYSCKKRNISIIINNAVLNESSILLYKILFLITGNLLKHISLILTSSSEQKQRFMKFGVSPDKIKITGNTKYDNFITNNIMDKETLKNNLGIKKEYKTIVLGSFHTEETKRLIDLISEVKTEFDNIKFILAPRYLEMISSIKNYLTIKELSFITYSSLLNDKSKKLESDCIILDTIGDLNWVYGTGDIAFVGGTFNNRGGQNIVEPVAAGTPVIYGPNIYNFKNESLELEEFGCGLKVKDISELKSNILFFLNNSKELSDLKLKAIDYIKKYQMVSDINLKHIIESNKELFNL